MSKIFKVLTECLKKQGVTDLDYCRDLLGLWSGDKKIASIGVQLRRFVSFHGVALNLDPDEQIERDSEKLRSSNSNVFIAKQGEEIKI